MQCKRPLLSFGKAWKYIIKIVNIGHFFSCKGYQNQQSLILVSSCHLYFYQNMFVFNILSTLSYFFKLSYKLVHQCFLWKVKHSSVKNANQFCIALIIHCFLYLIIQLIYAICWNILFLSILMSSQSNWS